jgi:hypothetical protein
LLSATVSCLINTALIGVGLDALGVGHVGVGSVEVGRVGGVGSVGVAGDGGVEDFVGITSLSKHRDHCVSFFVTPLHGTETQQSTCGDDGKDVGSDGSCGELISVILLLSL